MQRLFQRLPARGVLLILFLVFTIPFGFVVNRLVEEIDKSVEFAAKEQLGVQYNSSLRRFFEKVAQHQYLANAYLTKPLDDLTQFEGQQVAIDQAIQETDALDRTLNPKLQTTSDWQQIRRQWFNLKARLRSYSPETSLTEHHELLQLVQQLMAHAGDTSNLVLDPDLDTYYLMDAFVTKLPQMLKATAQARELSVAVAQRQSITVDEKVNLIVLYNSIQSPLMDLDRNAKVAFNANRRLESRLRPYFNLHGWANRDFLHHLRQISIDPANSQPETLLELANRAIAEQFSLYDAVTPNLHHLLQLRIDGFNERKRQVRAFGLAVALAVLALFAAIARNQAKRRRAEQRLNIQYVTTQTLATATDLHAAIAQVLQVICTQLEWDWGELWRLNAKKQTIHLEATWGTALLQKSDFSRATQALTIQLDANWIGQVWSQRKPAWLVNVAQSSQFTRTQSAIAAGIQTAVAVPICNDEQVLGVMAFFRAKTSSQDEDLLKLMQTLGGQIGQFIQRHQVELALRDRGSLLRLAMKSAGMGAWSCNLQTGEEFWSKEVLEIFGISYLDFQPTYERFCQMIHPDDRDRIIQHQRQTLEHNADYNVEFRICRPDDTIRWVNSQGSVVREADGTPIQMTGVAMDITRRKLAEAALQEAEENYRSIFENAADGIFQVTSGGVYLSANPALADILGYDSPNELIQVLSGPLEEMLYVDRRRRSELLQLIDQYGVVTDFELQVYRRDGTIIWISENTRAVRDEAGTLLYYEGIVKNINDRKRAAEELFNAKEAAEIANRAKSQFLANMSHELRTPLNAIIGYGEMLQEDAADLGYEEIVPDLEKIHGAGKHLLGLINDILDISKIEAGKMDLYLEDFNVASLIAEVQATVKPLIEQRGNTLMVQVQPDIGQMRSDLTKVRQMLFNLLSNAAKFTENGVISLTVTAQVDPGSSPIETIVLTVADTGIGIAPEKLIHLFQPFTQADASTTRKYGGTGLGLAITQRFCQMMQGQIQVQSEVGQGSKFTISLPRLVDRPQSNHLAHDGGAGMAALENSDLQVVPNGFTVLVIDDDATVRDLIVRQLGKEGYDVVVASSGQEGLHLARTLLPDVITLDVMMPKMGGWEVLTTLKADPDLAAIPVIVMTLVEEKNLGFTLGASDYLPKPIDYKRLIQLLQRYRPASISSAVGAGAIGHALIAEDDTHMRELFQRLLTKANWNVSTAENGRVALDRMTEQIPDVVLLDLMMPEVDGFQFLTTIRQQAEWRSVPVVVITAMTLTPEEEHYLYGSVERVLEKNAYSPDDLLAEVQTLVNQCIHQQHPREGCQHG